MHRGWLQAFLIVLCGCHQSRQPLKLAPDLNSFESDYGLVARVWASWELRPESIEVVMDSAVIETPGPRVVDSLPVFRNVAMSAVIGTHDSTAWRVVARSKAIPLPSPWPHGGTRRLDAARFSIARSSNLDPSTAWLGFSFAGMAVRTQSADRPFQTFVCSIRSLAASVDTSRAVAMARSYTAKC